MWTFLNQHLPAFCVCEPLMQFDVATICQDVYTGPTQTLDLTQKNWVNVTTKKKFSVVKWLYYLFFDGKRGPDGQSAVIITNLPPAADTPYIKLAYSKCLNACDGCSCLKYSKTSVSCFLHNYTSTGSKKAGL